MSGMRFVLLICAALLVGCGPGRDSDGSASGATLNGKDSPGCQAARSLRDLDHVYKDGLTGLKAKVVKADSRSEGERILKRGVEDLLASLKDDLPEVLEAFETLEERVAAADRDAVRDAARGAEEGIEMWRGFSGVEDFDRIEKESTAPAWISASQGFLRLDVITRSECDVVIYEG